MPLGGGLAAIGLACGVGNADHARTYDTLVEKKSVLEYIHHGTFRVLRGFHALDGLVVMRIKGLAFSLDAFEAITGQYVP
jgi:hypothetical protein